MNYLHVILYFQIVFIRIGDHDVSDPDDTDAETIPVR